VDNALPVTASYVKPVILCLSCGEPIPEATNLTGGGGPQEGDVSLCLYCGHVATFTGAGNEIRRATPAEVVSAALNPTVQAARRLLAGQL